MDTNTNPKITLEHEKINYRKYTETGTFGSVNIIWKMLYIFLNCIYMDIGV